MVPDSTLYQFTMLFLDKLQDDMKADDARLIDIGKQRNSVSKDALQRQQMRCVMVKTANHTTRSFMEATQRHSLRNVHTFCTSMEKSTGNFHVVHARNVV